jgi:pyruvate dehydrogenase kinase 2/3/4
MSHLSCCGMHAAAALLGPALTGAGSVCLLYCLQDEGGGIKRSDMNSVFSYLFTTAGEGKAVDYDGLADFGTSSPLAGLGYGLPVARSYARYFGGDLQIVPIEGYGTDAFIHLRRLGEHTQHVAEPLP